MSEREGAGLMVRDEVREILRREADEPGLYLTDPTEIAPYVRDWTGKFVGEAALVVRPRTTEQVASLLAACHRHRIAVVPQGGNTGLVGGSVPRAGEVVMSLSRMNAIEELDPATATARVGAGLVLAALQEHLARHDLAFAVDLGARGSCQIGGMIATNAGGIRVLRYGHMREQLRGLEVVLADGTVISHLSRLRKDNTGIDLKHLFVGSEGVLGVVTRAVLQATPVPRARHVAFCALPSTARYPHFLVAARREVEGLSSLEFLLRPGLDLVLASMAEARDPFGRAYPAYALIEAEGEAGEAGRERFLGALARMLEADLAADAALAQSQAQAAELWRLREDITEAISRTGLTHKFDVTVPPGALPGFLAEMEALATRAGGLVAILYGHLGDGNVHVNMVQAPGLSEAAFRAKEAALAETIYRRVAALEGSISAEHGIGVLKRAYLGLARSGPEIALMRRIKAELDPRGILNPGVMLPEAR